MLTREFKKTKDLGPLAPNFAVVLVEPQLGENIGMVARAMGNCALGDLRLVRPRDGWPNQSSIATASGADLILNMARVYETTADAVSDLQTVLAATARQRDMTKEVFTPREAARRLQQRISKGDSVGVLFGKESVGLHNDDVALASGVLSVPLNPTFASLNLAQVVFVVGYEWFQVANKTEGHKLSQPKYTRSASMRELIGLFEHLENELDARGFFGVQEKRPTMIRNIRNIFQRSHMTEQEVRTLRGVISRLTKS